MNKSMIACALVWFLQGCGTSESEAGEAVDSLLPSDTPCSVSKRDVCGEPVEAQLDAWRWYPVTGTQCLDGSETGFGVRLGSDAGKVVIYFEGGGACYNPWSCQNIFTDHFGADDFAEGKNTGIFNREDLNNPFRTWTQVYIPYCSGDMHSGSVAFGESATGLAHWGYQNISLYLKRLVPTFESAERIVLAGASAGGFGVTYNWKQFQQAFEPIVIDVINDSAPFLSESFLDPCYSENLSKAWNQQQTFDQACPGCLESSTGLGGQFESIRRMHQQGRYALITSAEDFVIRSHFAFANDGCAAWESMDSQRYEAALFREALHDYGMRVEGMEETFLYVGPGMGHVLLFDNFSDGMATQQEGVVLYDWLQRFVDGAPMESVMQSSQSSE